MSVGVAVHGKAPNRLRLNRLGLWLFIISESFLFTALLSSRYYLQGVARPVELNQALGLGITTVLLLSSLTAYRAEMFAALGEERRFLRNVLATLALGGIFLIGVTIEWAEAFAHFPPSSGFGTLFFTMTGLHAVHVVSGAILLLLVYFHGRRGRYSPSNYWAVEGAAKYWHFVDVVWVFIYPTLYLVS